MVHSWSIRGFQGSILGIVCRDVRRSCSRVCLTVCLSVFLGVCWLHCACTGSLALIFGSSRRCQGSILGHLGSPGVHVEASWAPFWGLWGFLGHLGGPLSPQGCQMIAQSLILAPFWSHFWIFLEVKIESPSKSFSPNCACAMGFLLSFYRIRFKIQHCPASAH